MAEELVIKINGDIRDYLDALEKAAKETEDLQNVLNTIAKRAAIAFAAFTASAGVSIAAFANFQDQLLGVKTLLDEASFGAQGLEAGFRQLSGEALGVLREYPVALDSINKSLFDTVSAGVNAGEAIGVVGANAKLAVAGQTDIAIATDGVTSALNAYQLKAKDADLIAAKFFTAQKYGKTTIEELSSFFGRAAAAAASYNVSLDELLAATAATTTAGIKTQAALSALPHVFSSIAKPTKEAAKEAKRLGIDFSSTALRAKGLTKFLDDLTQSQNFNQQSIERLFGSVEAQKIIFSLTGAQAKKYRETLDALSDSQKTLETFTRAYNEQSQSLKNQIIILKNNFKALEIVIGKELAPIIEIAAKTITSFLQFIQENPGLATFAAKIIVAGTATTGLITAVSIATIVLLKLRAALIANKIAVNGLKFAVKGLLGSTGFGLLIAFLPEIIEAFKFVFGAATDIVTGFSKNISKIFEAFGLAIEGFFTFDVEKKKKATEMLNKAVADSVAATIAAMDEGKKKDDQNTEIALANAEKRIKEAQKELDSISASIKKKTEAETEGFNKKIELLKNEQEILKATLAGMEKEELGFLKRRQDLRIKEAEAKLIKDEEERKLTLANLKLVSEQILKDEADLAKKRAEEKEKATAKRIAVEEAASLKELDLLAENEERKAALEIKEDERRKKEEEARVKRVEGIVRENELIEAALEGREQAEIDFLKRRQALREQTRAAEEISNTEERKLALENASLKYEQLIFDEKEYFAKRDALRAEQRELEVTLQAELQLLDDEEADALIERDLERLRSSLQTQEQIRSEAAVREIQQRRKEQKLRLDDERNFGKTYASIQAFFRSNEFSNAQILANQLVKLQTSKNKELRAIGKAAALVQISVDTARGAIAAYSALAGIPVVGPGLGIAAAAALTAYGLERAAQVTAAQQGALVEGVGVGDKIPFLLEPGELVVPRKNFEEVITSVRERRATQEPGTQKEGQQTVISKIEIGFTDDAIDILTVQQSEQRVLGISQEF